MVKSINPQEFNNKLALALKEIDEFKAPEWTEIVKTSSHKQRPTTEPNFYFKRAASILRQIYVKKILGVNKLRSRYGGRKDNGMKPARFVKSGGKLIRVILQQSESAGLLEKSKSKKAGRMLTEKGKKLLESVN